MKTLAELKQMTLSRTTTARYAENLLAGIHKNRIHFLIRNVIVAVVAVITKLGKTYSGGSTPSSKKKARTPFNWHGIRR